MSALLPAELWQRVEGLVTGIPDDPEAIGGEIVAWMDGRSTGDLEAVLDALRDKGAYPISLVVLEHAWNAELPAEHAGAIAQDWVGTVLHGLGDRAGAMEVAQHLVKTGLMRGASVAAEVGHALLGLGLHEVAAPALREAARRRPADEAAQFNLGVLQKFEGDYEGCLATFGKLAEGHPHEAVWWHLGIAATALKDWASARRAWGQLGFTLPPGDGDFAAAGDVTPVQLPTRPGARVRREVVWGLRLCPVRVRITTLPRFSDLAAYGDIVLIDGVPAGETRLHGEEVPVWPALSLWSRFGGRTCPLRGPLSGAPGEREAAFELAKQLCAAGWPAADWTGMPGAEGIELGVVIPPGRDALQAIAAVAEHAPALGLSKLDLIH